MLKKYRHHLPHWNLEGAYYFITFKAFDENFTLTEIDIILNVIKDGHNSKYELVAVQVMPDHVHLILKPNADIPLQKVMQWIKGVSALMVNKHRARRGSIWMIDYYDRINRNQSDFEEKLRYLYENPFRAGLTESPENYPGWFYQYS